MRLVTDGRYVEAARAAGSERVLEVRYEALGGQAERIAAFLDAPAAKLHRALDGFRDSPCSLENRIICVGSVSPFIEL